jgi:hypothetical protein
MALRVALTLAALLVVSPTMAKTLWVCTDNAEIQAGNFVLFNNVWNKGTTRSYEQCISSGDKGFRWRWRWPGGDLIPEAYPEIVFGHQPWRGSSTTDALPRRLRSVGALTVEYEARLAGHGQFNLAFQLWLVDRVPPAPDRARTELMVWVANRGMEPAGSRIGRLHQEGVTYAIYSARRKHFDRGVERRWDLLTLVADREVLTGPLEIGALLEALRRRSLVSGELWVANVDFGTELVSGAGSTFIAGYDVSVD